MSTSKSAPGEELLSHQAFLRRLARALVGDEADDLVQDVWTRALERPPADRRALRGWMARVARNLAANRRRGEARRREREKLAARPEAQLPREKEHVELEARFALQRELVAVLDELPEPYRRTLLLRYFQSLAPAQIADRDGISRATVKTRLRRGLERMRAALDRGHDGERKAWFQSVAFLAGRSREVAIVSTKPGVLWMGGIAMGSIVKVVAMVGVVGGAIWLFVGQNVACGAPEDRQAASEPAPVLVEGADDEDALNTPSVRNVERRLLQNPAEGPAFTRGKTEPVEMVPFHGVVIDERNGEPVPELEVSTYGFSGVTDDFGRFGSASIVRRTGEKIEISEALGGAHVKTLEFDALELLADGSRRLPVGIGPTYRVQLVGPGDLDPEQWEVELVESAFERRDRDWGLRPLRLGDPPWLRYEGVGWEPHPDYAPRLVARRRDNANSGAAPVETTVGIHQGVVVIEVSERLGLLEGRVIDTLGSPIWGTRVLAVPADADRSPTDPASWVEDRSDADGEYALPRLRPGTWWLSARPHRGEDPQVQEVLVPPGPSRAPDFVVPAQEPAGAITGRLENETGELFPSTIVRLRAADGRRFDLFYEANPNPGAQNTLRSRIRTFLKEPATFRFTDVPYGEYELAVVPLDGSTWSPPSMRVTPPAENLVFTRQEIPTVERLAFHVFDAKTGEPIESFFTQFQGDHYWYPGALPATPEKIFEAAGTQGFRWNLHAPGYALASGTREDFEARGDLRVATVRLEPGWGARLVLRDNLGLFGTFDTDGWRNFLIVVERPPVAGAEVYADGELVATSNAEGFAELRLDREPRRIEVHADGWRTLGSEHFQDGRLVGPPREVVVWMTRLGAR